MKGPIMISVDLYYSVCIYGNATLTSVVDINNAFMNPYQPLLVPFHMSDVRCPDFRTVFCAIFYSELFYKKKKLMSNREKL